MKMEHALILFDQDDYHMSKKLKSSNPDDKGIIRLERRWRRREAVKNSLNCVTNSTTETAMICGNKPVLKDEIDHIIDDTNDIILGTCTGGNEELGPVNQSLLLTYNLGSEIDTASNHMSSSNIEADFGNNTENGTLNEDYRPFLLRDMETDCASGHIGGSNSQVDADYGSFLPTYDIETGCVSDHIVGSNNEVDFRKNNGEDEYDADYRLFLPTYHEDVETDCARVRIVGSNSDINFGNNNEDDEMDADYGSFFSTYDPDCIRDGVGVYENDPLPGKSSNVRQNALLSDQEFHTPELEGSFNEEYALFLKSRCIDAGDFVYPCDKNTTNTLNVEDETNSSDSDLIVLESCPNWEDTAFVPSKIYDPSCFGEETNPEDNKHIVSYGQPQYRKRLVEQLDRPYDQEEYDSLLLKVFQKVPKDRHFETRQGVIENYSSEEVIKPYLQMYPDLAKAIIKEAKEKRRLLFLLRGFFFWIENVCHLGAFQPWQDESCLEIMRKM